MKTIGHICVLLALALALPLAAAPPRPIPGSGMDLDVDVWTDRGEGAVYRDGDPLSIYFRASDDCHVTIYSISTEGDVRILFPRYPDDGFVYGGITYRLPEYYEVEDLRVSGPRGVEYIHAIATSRWDGLRYGVRGRSYHLGISPITGDPFVAINSINERIAHPHVIRASATTWYFVDGLVWYPRYMCGSCHHNARGFDPYNSSCGRYDVVVTHGYDYWWGYDYYPARVHLRFDGPFWRFELRGPGVRRPHRHGYLNCAWGFGNYRPHVVPIRPHTRIVRVDPRIETRRGYVRNYEPVTYRQTRSRDYGTTRSRNERIRDEVPGSGRDRDGSGVSTPGNTRDRVRSDGTTRDRVDRAGTENDRARVQDEQIRTETDRSRTNDGQLQSERERVREEQARQESARARDEQLRTERERTRAREEQTRLENERARARTEEVRIQNERAREERVREERVREERVREERAREERVREERARQERAREERAREERVREERAREERVREERARQERARAESVDVPSSRGRDESVRDRSSSPRVEAPASNTNTRTRDDGAPGGRSQRSR
ncbi:MAG: DUF4384 domain-containing protein [Ignavibacteriae bacterium]|nr:DUF4384 domain-containing protein [Ignavibacteriota bacterium]